MSTLKSNYGSAAMYAGAAVGGAVLGSIAQKKIKFLDTIMGRVLLVILAIVVFTKAKSDVLKGVATGLAVTGATGFIKDIAGSVNGFEGFDGIDGLSGLDGEGVGQIVQDENGMIYMVNGVGELEPYYVPMIEGVDNTDEFDAISGVGSTFDAAMAAA